MKLFYKCLILLSLLAVFVLILICGFGSNIPSIASGNAHDSIESIRETTESPRVIENGVIRGDKPRIVENGVIRIPKD